ncbi:MAG: hypothetical protein ACNS62_17585 [Candidatus Cyclobacteriaceae bacterium M3_2C_046]
MQKLFFVVLLSVIGCAPVYVPNQLNVPLLNNQGEIQLNVSAGTAGIDIQSAMGLADHLGAMLNLSYSNFGGSDSSRYHQHLLAELGLGYFDYINETGRFEIYGGIGRGYGETYAAYDFNQRQSVLAKGRFTKLFIQGNLGKTTDMLDIAGSARASYLHFYEFQTENKISRETLTALFIEPALTAKAGSERFKALAQIGASIPISGNPEFEYQAFFFSLGLHLKLNRKRLYFLF